MTPSYEFNSTSSLASRLGLVLVLRGILVRVGAAGLDLIVIVQHRPRRRLLLVRDGIDHQPRSVGELPDIGFGRIGLA